MSLRFHLVVSDVGPGNKDFMWKRVGAKVFLRVSRDGKFFSLDLPQTVKKGCALAVRCGGVWNLWSQAKKLFEFVI